MSSILVPSGSLAPFGSQSFQEVLDRLHFRRGQRNFHVSDPVLQEGVLMTTRAWTSHKKHQAYVTDKLYPVADKLGSVSLLRHVSFDRPICIKDKTSRVNPRGGKIWGSMDRICGFIDKARTDPSLLNLRHVGVYWEFHHPQKLSVHPYLDIDIAEAITVGVAEYKFDDVFAPVYTTIQLFEELVNSYMGSSGSLRSLICYNRRVVGPGKIKHSFHVHWPDFVMVSMTDLAHAVCLVSSKAPMQPNGSPLLDTKPYSSSQQLFRLPYCGKMNDSTAALLPIQPYMLPSQCWTFRASPTPALVVIRESSICTVFPSNFKEIPAIRVQRPLPNQRMRSSVDVVASGVEDKRDFHEWIDFWRPVLQRLVVPNFVRYRQQEAGAKSVACSFPDADRLVITNIERLQRWPASFRLSVDGDTYCEYDTGSTPHVHRFNDNAVSYVVDLHKGRIAQQCAKCRPASLKWHPFIRRGLLTFPIMSGVDADLNGSDFVTVGPHADVFPFILLFFSTNILYARDTKQVMVFDESSGIWKTGTDGNRLLLQNLNALNTYHRTYLVARNMHIRSVLLRQFAAQNPNASDEDVAERHKKLDADYFKADKLIKPLFKVPTSARKELINAMKPDEHPHQVESMEPHNHLVPLLDRKCVDVYTWTVRPIRSNDYFVSCLNARLVDLADGSVDEFLAWQKQVCCGDPEYLLYKLRIMGLSLTMFNFDRAFYMPLGPVGRNGKGSESHLFNVVTMGATPARGYYMSREYLTKSGQDRKGANAADTVMTDLANKTIIIADEVRDVALDGPLIKALVSGDRQSGRNLYEAERTNVSSRGTLWIIANKTPKLDYTDPALMDRCRVLPYNARWVRKPADVKASMTDINQKMWVFQDNPYFKDKVLATWGDAMVTKCLYELHCFFKSLPRDHDNPTRPLKLESIPIPVCVKNATSATIEREHPVMGFLHNYMGQVDTGIVQDYVTVECAFAQFQRFGKNENSKKLTNLNRMSFQEALEKESIEVMTDTDGVHRFKGWKMTKDVPQGDSSNPVADGSFYCPPPAQKRQRVDDYEY